MNPAELSDGQMVSGEPDVVAVLKPQFLNPSLINSDTTRIITSPTSPALCEYAYALLHTDFAFVYGRLCQLAAGSCFKDPARAF